MRRLRCWAVAIGLVGLVATTAVQAVSIVLLVVAGMTPQQIVATLENGWNLPGYLCNSSLGAGDTLVVTKVGGVGTREMRFIVPAGTLPATHTYKMTLLLPSELPFRNNTDPGAPPFYILVDLDNKGDVFVPEGTTNFGDFMIVVTTTQAPPITGGGQADTGGLPALDPLRAALLGSGLVGIGLFYLLRRR